MIRVEAKRQIYGEQGKTILNIKTKLCHAKLCYAPSTILNRNK